jgi:hypothetical protein
MEHVRLEKVNGINAVGRPRGHTAATKVEALLTALEGLTDPAVPFGWFLAHDEVMGYDNLHAVGRPGGLNATTNVEALLTALEGLLGLSVLLLLSQEVAKKIDGLRIFGRLEDVAARERFEKNKVDLTVWVFLSADQVDEVHGSSRCRRFECSCLCEVFL